MENESIDKLKQLVERRQARSMIKGGEIFTMWGILNLISFFIFYFIWDSVLVWIIMLAAGISIQFFYIRHAVRKADYRFFWYGKINELWIFMLVLLPFIFFIFPDTLKTYTGYGIFPLIMLWLSVGMFISGLIIDQWSLKISGVIFIISSVLLAFFMEKWNIIYPATIALGLVVPGIWSKYEENGRKQTNIS